MLRTVSFDAMVFKLLTRCRYEQQPPGTTILYLLDGPEAGGDTLFCNQVEAYKRLSPEFQKRLHGLSALHSGRLMPFMAKMVPHTLLQPMSRRHSHKAVEVLSAASL